MSRSDTEVVVIGGGAAGVAAARRLHDAGVRCLIVEARGRLGGRAWTVVESGFALDLGCGWLHSADRNPWSTIAQQQGRTIDKTPPPWERPSMEDRFPLAEQREYFKAQKAFDDRLDKDAQNAEDRPASAFLEQGGRWNALMDAVSTYYSGAELERLSAHDLARYREDNANWRVIGGLGAAIEAYGAGLPAMLDCPVRRIDRRGKRLRIETAKGDIGADQAIVTLPTPLIANDELFMPALPHKTAAAAGLPLGLADKLFLSLEGAEEFKENSRLFGSIERAGTGSYNLRPFGWPVIECYFGGQLAWQLERDGEAAFVEFATKELTGYFGNSFARRISLLRMHRWGADPFAKGSYSYALPGKAGCRAILAEPVDNRLFFAGEACSPVDFSTAHGAFDSGVAAADEAIAARNRSA
jgi:monoamine oxidase